MGEFGIAIILIVMTGFLYSIESLLSRILCELKMPNGWLYRLKEMRK